MRALSNVRDLSLRFEVYDLLFYFHLRISDTYSNLLFRTCPINLPIRTYLAAAFLLSLQARSFGPIILSTTALILLGLLSLA